MGLIFAYIIAIMLANISVAVFGTDVVILNAFAFIAFDLTVRDRLHEQWQRKHLRRNMALLIATGSALSALLNANATPIAIASCVAFGAAAVVDTLVYVSLDGHSRIMRMNVSNVFSAAVDSFLFPALAFGFPMLWGIVFGQWIAKVLGGLLWSFVLSRKEGMPELANG